MSFHRTRAVAVPELDLNAGRFRNAKTVRKFGRNDAVGTGSSPYSAKRLIAAFSELSGPSRKRKSAYVELPAKTDVWFSAIADSNATLVDRVMDLQLLAD